MCRTRLDKVKSDRNDLHIGIPLRILARQALYVVYRLWYRIRTCLSRFRLISSEWHPLPSRLSLLLDAWTCRRKVIRLAYRKCILVAWL